MPFAELHARSAFSFLRGASQPDALAEQAAALGLSACALADRMGVFGSVRFHQKALAAGCRPLVGAEVVLEDGSALPVLCGSQSGYHHLCEMITRAKLRAPKEGAAGSKLQSSSFPNRERPVEHFTPELPWHRAPAGWTSFAHLTYAELAELGACAGLIALTGDRDGGPLALAWERGGQDELAAVFARLRQAFRADPSPESSRLFVEVERHQIRGENLFNQALQDLAERERIPLIATNAPLYATPEGRRVQDVFTCLRHHTHLDAAGRMLAQNHERQLKSEAAMRALFSDLTDAVTHTSIVAERLEFSLENLGYEFPKYPVPAGETMESFLRKITWFGAEHRYGSLTPSIRRQIEKELGLINKLGFAGYFLIVWDIVNYCRENRIMVQGRGSAANSAVCYALGITAVDPVGGQLLFERFLSEGRKGWPDIDLDLPSGDRREQVIQEVYQRYGEHGAAMTANVITYRGRSAVREIGKVLNFPEEAINRFASLFSHGDYPHTLDFKDQLAQAGIREEHPRAAALVALYKQIYGLPRHLGQHSGGMVICQGALSRVMPLEQASMPGRVVCQWDKDDCEDMGIIKVDLLGLGMMAVLQDALELCGDRGRPVDLAKIPKNDEATFELMTKADTIGVFQIESRAQMATLPRMGPKSFYDVAIEVAIIRPGPIVGKLAHPYLERRNGREPVDFIHPDVKPVLERTLGVPLFQEQVLKMAMVLAGFDGNDAEELRRAMSFHRSEERMLKATRKLRAALEARDHREDVVEKVLQAIGGFALYGFPESHAISFAILAYGSAYLKVHRPVEFYTGLLNNQPMGFYSASTLIQDAKRHGIRFKAPCVKESAWESRPTDDRTIRLGLKMVRGVTEKHVREMLAARGSAGAECSAPHARSSFVCLADFRRRTRFSKEELRELASAGALNCFTDDRRTALWEVAEGKDPDDLFSWAEGNPQLKATAQEPRAEARKRAGSAGAGKHLRPGSREASPSLLPSELPAETGQKTAGEQPRSLALRPMSPLERLNADYQATGVTVGRHPMALLRPQIPEIWSAAELKSAGRNERVQTAGAVICRQRPGTAKGVVFISLEDETGIGNCIVHPDLFEEFRLTIVSEPFLKITGTVQHAEGTVHLIAERIEPLGEDVLPPSASHDFH